jgi:hypothetical protein
VSDTLLVTRESLTNAFIDALDSQIACVHFDSRDNHHYYVDDGVIGLPVLENVAEWMWERLGGEHVDPYEPPKPGRRG